MKRDLGKPVELWGRLGDNLGTRFRERFRRGLPINHYASSYAGIYDSCGASLADSLRLGIRFSLWTLHDNYTAESP